MFGTRAKTAEHKSKRQPAPVLDTIDSVDTKQIRRRGWIITLLLLAFMVVNYADKAIVGLAGVDIKADLGLSNEQFGLVQSSFYWLFAVGAIVLSGLTSKVDARWMVAGLAALWCLTMIPLVGSVGIGLLVASRVLLGFAEGPASAVATHVVHTWFTPKRRALPSSLIFTGVALGPLLAAPTMTWVIETFDWHMAFLVLIVAGAVLVVAWLTFGREGPVNAKTTQTSDTATGVQLPDRVQWRLLLTRPTIFGIGLLLFCGYWSVSLKVTWLPLYLREGLNYEPGETGWLVTLPYASGVTLSLLFGFVSGVLTQRGVSSRVTRGLIPGVMFFATGASMITFTLLDRGVGQMIFIVLAFSLTTAVWGIALVAVSDVVPGQQRGVVLGAIVAVHSLGGIIAPLVLGALVDTADTISAGYGRGFAATGIVICVGAIISCWLVKPERDARALASTTVRATA